MAMPELVGRRQRAISLRDVPLKIRKRHGHSLFEAAVQDQDLERAMAIHRAVENPSGRLYWISAEAIERASAKW